MIVILCTLIIKFCSIYLREDMEENFWEYMLDFHFFFPSQHPVHWNMKVVLKAKLGTFFPEKNPTKQSGFVTGICSRYFPSFFITHSSFLLFYFCFWPSFFFPCDKQHFDIPLISIYIIQNDHVGSKKQQRYSSSMVWSCELCVNEC